MENNTIINNTIFNNSDDNNNYTKLSSLEYTSIHNSLFFDLLNAKTFFKETQLKLENLGFTDNSTALENKKKEISNFNKKTSKYVNTNLLNSKVYYNLPKYVAKTITVKNLTKTLNIQNLKGKDNYFNILPSYLKQYGKEGLYLLPKYLLNKFIKIGYNFVPELAASQIVMYKFNNELNYSIKNIYKILTSALNPTYTLISQPHIIESTNRVNISLLLYSFVLRSKNLKKSKESFLKRNEKRLENLCEILSQLFKKTINLEFVRTYKLSSDSNILAKAIGTLINKTKLRKLRTKFLKKAKIVNPSKIVDKEKYKFNSLFDTKTITPAHLSGLNVRVAGRVLSERVVPRKTVRSFQIGSLARGKANIVKTNRFTTKNKRGCYSVTIKTGHIVN
jgi:hypothetical protein